MHLGQNILIVGSPGAGKSTLAQELSQVLAFRVVHLDQLFWQAGWTAKRHETFLEELSHALADDGWICDGNYSSTLDLRLSRADTLIWLDFPRWRCLWRVMRRIAMYRGRTRPDMAEGCNERFDFSFLVYVWRFNKRHRPQLKRLFSSASHDLGRIRLKSPAEVRAFVASIVPG